MASSTKIQRRTVLKGIAGAALPLPLLEAMGKEVVEDTPRRFCALYTANGMSLPKNEHGINQWSWFPTTDGKEFEFGERIFENNRFDMDNEMMFNANDMLFDNF